MPQWKANKRGFVGNRLIEPGDVFNGPEGMDFKWAEPLEGERPIEVKPAPSSADTFAGIQAGPRVAELSAVVDEGNKRIAELSDAYLRANQRAADLEARLTEALAAAPVVAEDGDAVKALKSDLRAAQKRIKELDAAVADKDQEISDLVQNRDDWKKAYDDLKEQVADIADDEQPNDPG